MRGEEQRLCWLAALRLQPTPAPATPKPVAPTPTPVPPTPVPTKPPAEKVKITFWHGEAVPTRVEVFQTVLDRFMKDNPGIEVTQEAINWPDAFAKDPAAIQAGTAPDLRFTAGDHFMAMKEMGAIQPMDDIFEDLNGKYQISESATARFRFDGHVWAVPVFMLVHSTLYDSCWLKNAGFEQLATDWDEFLVQAKALAKGDKYAIAIPASKHTWTLQCLTDVIGGTGVKDIFDEKGEVAFNRPEIIRAYKFYLELLKYAPPDNGNWTWAEGNLSLISGQSAMSWVFGAPFGRFPTEAPDRADCFKAGAIPWAKDGVRAHVGSTNAVVIYTKDPKKREAIHTFLNYLFEPETNGYWLANMQPLLYLPVTVATRSSKSFFEQPIIQRYKETVPHMLESVDYAVEFGFGYRPNPKIGPIAGDFTMAQVLQKVTIDKWDVEKAVKWGHDRMVELTS
mgnify:CR=1 FL=1